MQGQLFRVTGWGLPADDHLPPDFLDDQVANPPMGELANLSFDSLNQAGAGIQAI